MLTERTLKSSVMDTQIYLYTHLQTRFKTAASARTEADVACTSQPSL